MALDVPVLTVGVSQPKQKAQHMAWKINRILFFAGWFVFLIGEIFYIITYVL
jgi:hypothetical protein